MAFVFLALAAGLAVIAWKLDRYDRAMRWTLFGFAAFNAIGAVVAIAAGDWHLLPALRMEWW